MKSESKKTIEMANHIKLNKFQMEAAFDLTIHDRRPITRIADKVASLSLKYG